MRIAELTGREKSQVSRSLKTLAEYGVVERDPTTLRYRLGWRLFTLAARAGMPQLLELARPLLARLVERTGEGAYLTVLQGAEVLTVAEKASPHVLQTRNWVGSTVPSYSSAPGRALLVDHSDDELEAFFSGEQAQRMLIEVPADLDEVCAGVARARRQGYAAVLEDVGAGYASVGSPVRDFTGLVVAALNVSGPEQRLGERLEEVGGEVKAAAEELSAQLGWSGNR